MNRIDGKVAVVTGSTQGLGAAVALQLAQAGAAGIITCGRGADKGERVARAIESQTGVPVHFVQADLANLDQVHAITAVADERFGRIDILVNAAGLTDRGNILNTSAELFDRMFAINTRAPFFLIQDACELMLRDGIEGRIVNIGSMSELAGQPFLSAYCSSKGALATLTRNTAYALMRNRIRVNQLDIGWMNSDHERKLVESETGDPEFIDKAAAQKPFGRLIEPAEVAKAVLWMVSEDSGMMTGSVIQFDQSVWGAYDDAPTPAAAMTLG